MNREDIIAMAREIGIEIYANDTHLIAHTHELERFAQLVAQAEREACAKIAETAEPYQSADLILKRGQA